MFNEETHQKICKEFEKQIFEAIDNPVRHKGMQAEYERYLRTANEPEDIPDTCELSLEVDAIIALREKLGHDLSEKGWIPRTDPHRPTLTAIYWQLERKACDFGLPPCKYSLPPDTKVRQYHISNTICKHQVEKQ